MSNCSRMIFSAGRTSQSCVGLQLCSEVTGHEEGINLPLQARILKMLNASVENSTPIPFHSVNIRHLEYLIPLLRGHYLLHVARNSTALHTHFRSIAQRPLNSPHLLERGLCEPLMVESQQIANNAKIHLRFGRVYSSLVARTGRAPAPGVTVGVHRFQRL